MSPARDSSVVYDKIADRYDATRGYTDAGSAHMVEMLSAELRERGSVIEIGVGTGQVALRLNEAGVPVAGVDLSARMLSKLLEKAGGSAPFPLVLADAGRLPFATAAFGGAYFRWILHLIADWRGVMAEALRVVQPGGVIAGEIGGYLGPKAEVQRRYEELAGIVSVPIGLPWSAWGELDAHMEALGCGAARALAVFEDRDPSSLADFIREIEANTYSWTWKLDEQTRTRTAREVRAWAQDRWGDLEAVHQVFRVGWHAYDVPG